MKKVIGIAFLVFFMASFSTVYAADAPEQDMAKATTQAQDTAAESAGIIVSGTINDANQLIDAQGKAFELSEKTEQGLEVKALVGQKVQLKGTVLEAEGQNVMQVQEYKILGGK